MVDKRNQQKKKEEGEVGRICSTTLKGVQFVAFHCTQPESAGKEEGRCWQCSASTVYREAVLKCRYSQSKDRRGLLKKKDFGLWDI